MIIDLGIKINADPGDITKFCASKLRFQESYFFDQELVLRDTLQRFEKVAGKGH